MGTVSGILAWLAANGPAFAAALLVVLVAFIGLCSALVAFFAMIPGEQPEKAIAGVGNFFQKIADFVAKFSKKKE